MASDSALSKKVWLITGCSSGMGLAFAYAALEAGYTVIATSRNPSKSEELVSHFTSRGSHWLPLDVTASEDMLNAQLDAAIALHGRIDVLLNNAGLGYGGSVEDTPMEDVRKIFETNFFGVWKVTKKIVPVMREQKSGVIITNSSIFSFCSMPTVGVYASAKHALTGLMDSLSWEMSPFGVKVILLESGGVRTQFVNSASMTPISEPYKGTIVQSIPDLIRSQAGNEASDPNRIARRVVEAVDGKGITGAAIARLNLPMGYAIRLPMGSDCRALYGQYAKLVDETLKQMNEVCKSTDFEDTEKSGYAAQV